MNYLSGFFCCLNENTRQSSVSHCIVSTMARSVPASISEYPTPPPNVAHRSGRPFRPYQGLPVVCRTRSRPGNSNGVIIWCKEYFNDSCYCSSSSDKMEIPTIIPKFNIVSTFATDFTPTFVDIAWRRKHNMAVAKPEVAIYFLFYIRDRHNRHSVDFSKFFRVYIALLNAPQA